MPVGPVIINNTPLVALWSLEHVSLLQALYGEVLMPPAVYEEFLVTEHETCQKVLEDASWLKLTYLKHPRKTLVYVGLDQGEAEVLALAEERSARLVIMDERRGRRYAKRLGYPLTGTLGVLLAAKEKGLLAALFPLLEKLLQEGLYLTPELVDEVLALAGEDKRSLTF